MRETVKAEIAILKLHSPNKMLTDKLKKASTTAAQLFDWQNKPIEGS